MTTQTVPSTHTVPTEVFDLLASGDGDMGGALRSGQLSKRLLLLHELMSRTLVSAPQLCADARAEEAFAVLADAQRRSRQAVDEVLLQPHVGAWAAHCLRRLMSGEGITPEDIGHLGAVAAAAALRAGLGFEVSAYPRDGAVMFPGYGLARPRTEPGWCRVRSRSGAGGVEISAGTTTIPVPFAATGAEPEWLALRRLRSSAAGVVIDVDLDDLDPFRGCGHLPALDRLDAATADQWQVILDEAWQILAGVHGPRAEAIAAGTASIVPLDPGPTEAELSGTCHDAIGAIATTPPRHATSLVLALVHEAQHNKLGSLLDLVPLVHRSPDRSFYAPWRSDPRPLRGLLQGTYAYLGLAAFAEVQRHRTAVGKPADDDAAHFEFALSRDQVAQALDTLCQSGWLTPMGERFIAGMCARAAELGRRPVPVLPLRLARLALVDHATSWRLRNVVPDPDLVEKMADAWVAGRSCRWPGRILTTVIDGGGPIPSNGRLALFRDWLAHPDHRPAEVRPEAVADVLLVAEQTADARKAYCARLAEDPDDLASWGGLALLYRDRSDPAAWALTTFPEVVHALHLAIRARSGCTPEVDDVAHWMAHGGQGSG